jgi:hypothetical protein
LKATSGNLIVGGIVLSVGTILAGVARKVLWPSAMIPNRTMRKFEADARVIKESAA